MAAYSEEAIRAIEKEIIRSTIGQRLSLSLFAHGHDSVIEQIRRRTHIESLAAEVQGFEQLASIAGEEKKIAQSVQQTFSDLLIRDGAYIFELMAEVRLETISKEDISEIERLQLCSYFLTEFILYYPYAEDSIQKNSVQMVISTPSGEISRRFPLEFAGIHSSLTRFKAEIIERIGTLEKQVQEQILEEEWKTIPEEQQQRILIEEKEKILWNRMLIEQRKDMLEDVRESMLEAEEEKMWEEERKNMLKEKQQAILRKELDTSFQQRILVEEHKRISKGEREKWKKMTPAELKQKVRDLQGKIPQNQREQMLKEEWDKIPGREQILKTKWKKMFVSKGELERRLDNEQKKILEMKWKDMQQEDREKISKKKWDEIPEAERDALLKEELSRRLEKEQGEQSEKERNEKLRAEISIQAFNELLPAFQTCLSVYKPNPSEEKPLDIQLTAVRTIINELTEKEEADVLSGAKLPTDEEEALVFLKTFYMGTRKMSAEEAGRTAQAALKLEIEKAAIEKAEYERAVSTSIDSSSTPPPPPPPSLIERVTAGAKADVISQGGSEDDIAKVDKMVDSIKKVVLRRSQFSDSNAAKQDESFLPNREGLAQQAALRASNLTKVTAAPLKKVDQYKAVFSEKLLPEAPVKVYVLSTLPKEEALKQLENGYLLTGYKKPRTATLYYKDGNVLIQCYLGNLEPLCVHVSKVLEENETCLTLERKEHFDLIASPCGNYHFKLAEDAVPAPVLARSVSLQPGPSARFSFHASQKNSLLDGYGMKLVKDDKDWPEDAAVAEKTLYFKWDKSKNILTVKYKKEDGTVSGHERVISPQNIKLIPEPFEQPEGAILTLEVRNFLEFFAATPIVRPMSVVLPKGELNQSPAVKSDVSVLDSGKEEEVKEDVKKGIAKKAEGEKAEIASEDSLDKEANLSSSPSSFYATAPLPLPLIKESDTNLSVKKSEEDSKLNSERTSPGL